MSSSKLQDPPFWLQFDEEISLSYTQLQGLAQGGDDAIEAFWNHSSPLLRLQMLQSLSSGYKLKHHDTADRAVMVETALLEARQEGVAWTPLLDQLAEMRIWPAQRLRGHFYQEHDLPSPTQQAGKLASWVQQQNSPENLEPLFDFEAAVVGEVLASHVSVLSEAQQGALLEDGHALTLVENENLPSSRRQQIVDRFYEELGIVSSRDKASWRPVLSEAARRGLLSRKLTDTLIEKYAHIRGMEKVLIHAEHLTTEQLQQVSTSDQNTSWVAAHSAACEAVWDQLVEGRSQKELATLVGSFLGFVESGKVDRDHQEKFYRYVLNEELIIPWKMRFAIATRIQDLETAELLMEVWGDNTDMREYVAARPALRTHPPIREILSRSRLPEITAPLIVEAEVDDLVELVRSVASRDPAQALEALEKRSDLDKLPEEVFLAIIEQGGPPARQALRLLARTTSGQTRQPDTPSPPSSRAH